MGILIFLPITIKEGDGNYNADSEVEKNNLFCYLWYGLPE
jgi:hypothetical protein